jgi:alkylation response protein AidB-like acyl-CoA dehydrogenase
MKPITSFSSLAKHRQRQIHSDREDEPFSADLVTRVERSQGGDGMSWGFPTDREAKRRALLDAVERARDNILSGADEAEAMATLPRATVNALYKAGLFALKLPAVLGGAEADPVTQMEVIEAIARLDASAAWCVMIGATTIATPAVFLPDAAVAQMFAGSHVPMAAGVLMPTGQAVSVDGGYIVSGRWAFASGIRHAHWVSAAARVLRNDGEPPEVRWVVLPVSQVQIHDNWQVVGLKGTGSCDFSVSDHFVPADFTFDMQQPPRRGGPLYRLGIPGFVANEHAAFSLGVGRHALDTIAELAQSKRRGFGQPTGLATRAAFQRELAECDLRLRAARALIMEIFERAWKTVCRGDTPSVRLQAEMRSAAAFTTEAALDAVTRSFRYAGGTAVYLSHILQRSLRDLNTAAQHFMVSNSAYENYGKCLLGLPDANPMG